ncbi:hypothetical protein ACFOUR_17390 [Halovivax cerinus]|uniref:Uncharacterized protein n=1 Tax=Halovivax cerinus TaxID=1487865 RepID=A0ABD5NT48_9EURY
MQDAGVAMTVSRSCRWGSRHYLAVRSRDIRVFLDGNGITIPDRSNVTGDLLTTR